MYAIVRCGGRQEKASVDDVLTVDRLTGEVGSTLTLPALLVVDGDNVVTDPEELGGYQVAAEIVGDAAGPKISIIRFKNKTGYRRRLGHRQHYTQVKITGITKGGKSVAVTASASKGSASKASASKSATSRSAAGKTSAGTGTTARSAAAKDAAAKDAGAKGTAAKDTAATGTAAKDTAAKGAESKSAAAKSTAAKGTAAKAEAAAESAKES